MREPANLGVITRRDRLTRWLERLRGGPLGVDTETTGLSWDHDRVGGLCLAANDTAIYAARDALEPALVWLSDQARSDRPLVFHSAKNDMHWLRGTFGLRITRPVDDVWVMSFLIDNRGVGPSESHELKELAAAYVDPRTRDAEERLRLAVIAAGGRGGKREKQWKNDILLAPIEIVGEYGALDAWYTLQLFLQFSERIDHWSQPEGDYPSLRQLYENERWLTLALTDMEERGVPVDLDFLQPWRDELATHLKKIEHQLNRMAKTEINWNSPQQISGLLFDRMGLKPSGFTKTGKPATDEVAMLKLKHPIGALILQHREADKQLGTYAEGLIEAAHSWNDGRIHCSFNQNVRTGRMSCRRPNLQQQTRESGVRKAFVPEKGLVFRFADNQQAEMRVAAHVSNDPTLVHGFRHDPNFDTHAATAKKMWGLRDEPSKQRRKFAKIMNFAMLFGAGLPKIASQLISMLTLTEARHACKELGHTTTPGEPPHLSLATILRDIYFREFPAVKGASYRAKNEAENLGYTVNAYGRHRYLDDRELHKTFNTIIQGSAADLSKHQLVVVYRELQQGTGELAILLQIHDEIVYLSEGDPCTDRRVLELMNDATSFRIPIVAEISGSAKNWQEKESIKL